MFYNLNMLKQIKIENIALIDSLTIDFFEGLNVLSGETGAGKSIIIDSLSFVLGGKFDKNLIRTGQTIAKVSAFFDSVSDETKKAAEKLGISLSQDVLLYRSGGEKNECKINGENVTLSMLKEVASTLVDIHGQNENQRILNTKNQLTILDEFCGNDAKKIKEEIESLYAEFLDVKNQIVKIGGNREERERSLDFLKFEVKEIEDAKLRDNEDVSLAEEKSKMLAGEKIATNVEQALSCTEGAFSVSGALGEAISHILNVSNFDSKLEELASRLKSSRIELNDIFDELENYRKDLNFSQYEFDKVDQRLDKIKMLKKKYGSTTDEIFSFLEKTKKQIDEIENSSTILEELDKKKNLIEKNLKEKSEKLSKIRKEAALVLEEKVCLELSDLAMKGSKFKIDFQTTEISKSGTDAVEFLFSANAGQSLKPLGKIISGGEMSRFCLAIKNITFAQDSISTMIFDEVDTGISGKVAEVVAEKMVRISRDKQVLSITHLPQIVAMADKSIQIQKQSKNGQTTTSAQALDEAGHIGEVARLIGSNMSSTHASEHAKDLINFGEKFKESLKNE